MFEYSFDRSVILFRDYVFEYYERRGVTLTSFRFRLLLQFTMGYWNPFFTRDILFDFFSLRSFDYGLISEDSPYNLYEGCLLYYAPLSGGNGLGDKEDYLISESRNEERDGMEDGFYVFDGEFLWEMLKGFDIKNLTLQYINEANMEEDFYFYYTNWNHCAVKNEEYFIKVSDSFRLMGLNDSESSICAIIIGSRFLFCNILEGLNRISFLLGKDRFLFESTISRMIKKKYLIEIPKNRSVSRIGDDSKNKNVITVNPSIYYALFDLLGKSFMQKFYLINFVMHCRRISFIGFGDTSSLFYYSDFNLPYN